MDRTAVLFPLALVLVCGGGCRHEPGQDGGDGGRSRATLDAPEVRCQETRHDFGSVRQGQPVRHVFELRNSGPLELTLGPVQTDRPWATALASQTRIPPGQAAQIEVRLDTRGQAGKQTAEVTVPTNDPQAPELKLSLTGSVELLAGFTSERIYLREVLKGTTRTEKVGLAGTQIDALAPGEPVSNAPGRLSGAWVEQDGQRVLEVTFEAGQQEGRFRGRITVATGLPEPKELRLTVNARVTGDLVADRSHLTFAPYEQDRTPAFHVALRSLSGKPFQVEAIEDPTGVVTGRAEQSGTGWRVSLHLGKAATEPRGQIRIRTDRADQPLVTLSYLIRPQSQAKPSTGLHRLKDLRRPTQPALRLKRPLQPGTSKSGSGLRPVTPKKRIRLERTKTGAPRPAPVPPGRSDPATP